MLWSANRAPTSDERPMEKVRTAFWRWLAEPSSRFGVSSRERRMVDQIFASWNLLIRWLRRIEGLIKALWPEPVH